MSSWGAGRGLSLPMRQPCHHWGSARCLSAAAQCRQAASLCHPPDLFPQAFSPRGSPGVWEPRKVHRHLPQSQRMAGQGWRAPCPTTPSMSPLSSLGDQYLKNTQNHPTWRMRAVPHTGNLLFSPPRKHRAHSGKATGVFPSSPPPLSNYSPTGITNNSAQPPALPNSNTHTSSQTPLFPSSFTTGTEGTKCEKIGLFVPPTPRP